MDMVVQDHLTQQGIDLIHRFCDINKLRRPAIHIPKQQDKNEVYRMYYNLNACAFFLSPDLYGVEDLKRKEVRRFWGVFIMPDKCGVPARGNSQRMISWPGGITDRTPYGVCAHELGHYLDWLHKSSSGGKWLCAGLKRISGEKAITGYGKENDSEWFAESVRLFVTNPALMKLLRPRTYALLRRKYVPLFPEEDWMSRLRDSKLELGSVPSSVVSSITRRLEKET